MCFNIFNKKSNKQTVHTLSGMDRIESSLNTISGSLSEISQSRQRKDFASLYNIIHSILGVILIFIPIGTFFSTLLIFKYLKENGAEELLIGSMIDANSLLIIFPLVILVVYHLIGNALGMVSVLFYTKNNIDYKKTYFFALNLSEIVLFGVFLFASTISLWLGIIIFIIFVIGVFLFLDENWADRFSYIMMMLMYYLISFSAIIFLFGDLEELTFIIFSFLFFILSSVCRIILLEPVNDKKLDFIFIPSLSLVSLLIPYFFISGFSSFVPNVTGFDIKAKVIKNLGLADKQYGLYYIDDDFIVKNEISIIPDKIVSFSQEKTKELNFQQNALNLYCIKVFWKGADIYPIRFLNGENKVYKVKSDKIYPYQGNDGCPDIYTKTINTLNYVNHLARMGRLK